jgi:hypothetical protein
MGRSRRAVSLGGSAGGWILVLLHGGLRNAIVCVGLSANRRDASFTWAEEVGMLNRVCPYFVSARSADEAHDEDEEEIYHDCKINKS